MLYDGPLQDVSISKRPRIVAPDAILGREAELAAADRFFDSAPQGPTALLIEGEAGIGKTTIWHEAVRRGASTSRVLVSRASENETKLSFTVLTDLLEPALDDAADDLPAPQRRALEAALLREDVTDGTRLDARAVSLGVLGVLRSLAALGPVTLAIDDLQWTDPPSARCLAFALRRMVGEQITVVATRRITPQLQDPLDLAKTVPATQRLLLGPVDVDVLGRLLRRSVGAFPHPLAVRIHDAAGGNPFFGLEIGRALVRLGVRPSAGEPLPVPEDLQALLRAHLSVLGAHAQEVLLIAASTTAPTVALVKAMGGRVAALEEAAGEGVIMIRGPAIEFTHPLLAFSVYSGASSTSRRIIHARFAEISTDPEEKARHLALSSSGPDPQVAEVLDLAVIQARARGAPQAAAELGELALAATPEGDLASRERRTKSQAGNLFDAGDPPRAREILEGMIALLEPGPARSDALCLLSGFFWKDLRRVSELLDRALLEVGDNPRLRSRILSNAAWVELDMGRLAAAVERGRDAAELIDVSDGDAQDLRLTLSVLALTEFLRGHEKSELMEHAVSLQGSLGPADLSSPATCLGRQLTWVGDLDAARHTLESELERYREQGHETSCYEILAHLADVEYRAGRFQRARQCLNEASDIAVEAGIDVMGEILPVGAAVECVTGDADVARSDAIRGLEVCDRTGDRWNEVRCRSVLGLVDLSLADPAAAKAWLEPLPAVVDAMGLREPGVFPFVPDLVEALAALGELKRASALTDELEQRGRRFGRSLALGTAERCHGLIAAALGDLAAAAIWLERSCLELEGVAQPFETARSLLVAGEIQRRMKKKRSTRTLLGEALVIFEGMGAHGWAERARRDLARIGGRAPTSVALTPSEQQIADLVAEGRTNREVASAMFVSVHTVEANLKRIYRKLGVRSRTELARRLAERSPS